jgi:Txe/YoeB family toxin of Txe-Axe toxin-antitoxin module
MRPVKKADGIIFADSKTEKAFNLLAENSPLKKSLRKAISDLKENVFCGEKISYKLIPKGYIKKYKIDNLFWYKLSKEWRLVYSIAGNNIEVLAIIIEYFSSHKEYERRFKY